MPGLVSQLDNRLLIQAQKKTEASVPEQYRRGYTSIVAAGLKAMFSDKTFPLMKSYLAAIKSPQDIPQVVAHGIVKLMSILFNESKGKMPLEPSVPAAIVLMTHALDYIEEVMKMPIDANTIASATDLVDKGMLHLIKQASGLSDADMQQIIMGKGKELAASKQAQPPQAGALPSQAGAPPAPMQGGV